MLVNALTNVH